MRTILLLTTLALLQINPSASRRGALVRDGMSSKISYDNPLLGQSNDLTMDPDAASITSKCPNWAMDPVCLQGVGLSAEEERVCKEVLGQMTKKELHVTFKSARLGGGKRPNWMRATAVLGNPKLKTSTPLRAVWTTSNPNSDTSMTYDEISSSTGGRAVKREIGKNTLTDNYEDCLKRIYGKYVELEVLLPKNKAGPPPSLVYRVPITNGSVNPFGVVSKSRATVMLYPKGRTLANNAGGGANEAASSKEVAIPVGLANVHVPLGPGLVDPSWARGKKLFWKGRSVGLL